LKKTQSFIDSDRVIETLNTGEAKLVREIKKTYPGKFEKVSLMLKNLFFSSQKIGKKKEVN